MRGLFLLLFLFSSLLAVGQDTCRLSFQSSNGSVTQEHRALIEKTIGDNEVLSLNIIGQVPREGNISTNRILTELRVQSVQQLLLKNGYPFNKIQSSINIIDNKENRNVIKLVCQLGETKGAKVLKKTPIVQIKEVDYTPKPVVVEKKPEKKIEKEPEKTVANNEVLKIEDFKKDEKIRLPNLLFEPGTHFILPGSEKVLSELLNIMEAKPKLRIELQGHICCRIGGMDGFDPTTGLENLSEMRAKVVYLYLISKGINKERMNFRGFGSSRKIYPNDLSNRMAARQNRRVEVLITDTD